MNPINIHAALRMYSPLDFRKDFKQHRGKTQIFNKVKYKFKTPGEKNETEGIGEKRRHLTPGARLLREGHTTKSFTSVAGGQPCSGLEASSGQNKEGNKTR